jgi:hypothetical protein
MQQRVSIVREGRRSPGVPSSMAWLSLEEAAQRRKRSPTRCRREKGESTRSGFMRIERQLKRSLIERIE